MNTEKQVQTIPQIMYMQLEKYSQYTATLSKDSSGIFTPMTYRILWDKIAQLTVQLHSMGLKKDETVAIISDNRWEWIVSNLAILTCGGCDVPRGTDSVQKEVIYILNHASCKIAFAENIEQSKKILNEKPQNLQHLIIFDSEDMETLDTKDVHIYSFSKLLEQGGNIPSYESIFQSLIQQGSLEDTASIIYTSGTTGLPKGVVLSHKNFIFQLERLSSQEWLRPASVLLCILPIWHSFERIVNYTAVYMHSILVYSNPIASILTKDMKQTHPHITCAVPRIWEGIRAGILRNVLQENIIKQMIFFFFLWIGSQYTFFKALLKGSLTSIKYPRIYILDVLLAIIPFTLLAPFRFLGNTLVFKKIKEKMGGNFQKGISGGSALPAYVDRFFEAIGIPVFEGYGLTETAPVIAVNTQKTKLWGTVGLPLKNIEYKIITSKGKEARRGKAGELMIRSDQVMKGYHKNIAETKKVLSDDGWFRTGDLALRTRKGAIKIIGRVKDTIVLRNGENVEPEPLEMALCQSSYIDYAMAVGQDQPRISALIFPNEEKAKEFAKAQIPNIQDDLKKISQHEKFITLIKSEIRKFVNVSTGFKPHEHIGEIHIIPKTLSLNNELSLNLKIKRFKIYEIYKPIIKQLNSAKL